MSFRQWALVLVLALFLILDAALSWLARGTPLAIVLDNVHWTVGFVAAAAFAWWGWLHSEPGTAERRFRGWLAIALGLYAAGQVVWACEVIVGSMPFPGPSDALETLLAPAIVVGLVTAWKMTHGTALPLGRFLDALIVTLGSLVLTLGFYLPQQGSTGAVQLALMILYPVLLFGAASLFLVMMMQDGSRVHPVGLIFLGSLAGDAFLWMNWNLQILQGTLTDGNPVNVVFSLLALSLGVSGVRWTWPPAQQDQGAVSSLILLPLLGVLAAFAGSVLLMKSAATPTSELIIASLSVAIVALAVLSQLRIVKTLRNAKETEKAMVRLRQTQGQLARSEKLASMGQLIAGIAHELNTPLASIRSSSGILRSTLKSDLSWFAEPWSRIGAGNQKVFLELLGAQRPPVVFLESHSERQLRKELEAEATKEGHPRPQVVAELLLETRLHGAPHLFRPLWKNEQMETLLGMLEPFVLADRMAEALGQASDRASQVVDALRNYLHADTSEAKELVDLTQNIEAVLPLFQHRLRHQMEFRSQLEPGLAVWVSPDRVSQVWVNLITNALQAMEDRGTLTVESRRSGDWVEVCVCDTGPGVPPELRTKIFEPFFTTKPTGEGTGLGLGVCRSILEECGGSLEVTSSPGDTRFKAKFPVTEPTEPVIH